MCLSSELAGNSKGVRRDSRRGWDDAQEGRELVRRRDLAALGQRSLDDVVLDLFSDLDEDRA